MWRHAWNWWAASVLLILELSSRWAGLLLTINLIGALSLVKVNVGVIAPPESETGAELDPALIVKSLTILLVGPGKLSLDHILGIEKNGIVEMMPQRNASSRLKARPCIFGRATQ